MKVRKTKQADRIRYAFKRGYKVSEDGREVIGLRSDRPLTLREEQGYLLFNVSHPVHGIGPVKVHQLQAYRLWGEKSLEVGIQVRHLNHDRSDNSEANLALGTARDNYMDQSARRRRQRAEHAAADRRALEDGEVRELRELYEGDWTMRELADEFEISLATVHSIVHRRTYKNVE